MTPDAATATPRLVLNDNDAEYLLGVVPRHPSHDADHDPVTVDFNGQVAVLAKSVGDSPMTQLVVVFVERKSLIAEICHGGNPRVIVWT